MLRTAALFTLLASAIGTVVCIFRIGHNAALFLLLLFVGWDFAPLVALVMADVKWPRQRTKTLLYVVMSIVALGSISVYGYVAYGPPRPQPAAPFLVVPVISWLLIGGSLGPAFRRAPH